VYSGKSQNSFHQTISVNSFIWRPKRLVTLLNVYALYKYVYLSIYLSIYHVTVKFDMIVTVDLQLRRIRVNTDDDLRACKLQSVATSK